MASEFIKGLVEKTSMLVGDWFVIQPDAEDDIAYRIKKSNIKSAKTEPNTWYLNTNGSDSNVGSDKFPFKNPQAAHDAASEGDILFFQDREYFSNQNVTVTKSLTLKGAIPANDNDIAAPFIGGTWDIASGKDLMIINLWVAAEFTHPSASWFLQTTGCHLAFAALPARKTKLITNDCLWELDNSHNLFSLVMKNTKAEAEIAINIGSGFVITEGSEFGGSITSGIDTPFSCILKNSSIEGAATITGDLLKVNGVIVGTETVSGTPTSRQAKVFDDPVLFKGTATANTDTVKAFTATPEFDLAGGNDHQMTLTGNVTSFTTTGELGSAGMNVYLINDGTAGRTVAAPTGWTADTTSETHTTAADAINRYQFYTLPNFGTKFYNIHIVKS